MDLRIAACLTALIKAGDATALANIGKCGRDAKDALPLLKQLKLNPQGSVRAAADEAISQIEEAVNSAGNEPPKTEPPSPKKEDPPVKVEAIPSAEDSKLPAASRS
jgi:hypothetical protein